MGIGQSSESISQGATFIIIDERSLNSMLRGPLRIRRSNFKEIYEVLVSDIAGGAQLFGKPMYVLPPSVEASIGKPLRDAGFNVQPVPSENSQDDHFIIEVLLGLDPTQVGKIILVSADISDYYSCLEAKRNQGIAVHIVATKTEDPRSGASMISTQLTPLLGSVYEFTDLATFVQKIAIEMYAPQTSSVTESDSSGVKKIRWTLAFPESVDGSDLAARHALLKFVDNFVTKYGLRICTLQLEETRGVVALDVYGSDYRDVVRAFNAEATAFILEFDIEPSIFRYGDLTATSL
ncbi:MAG: hypothetical protein HY617_00660 [Candidatus Sungbacteria bacterium]|nr:hypothetical protein [Candidatus Sungbacteria bacterium]